MAGTIRIRLLNFAYLQVLDLLTTLAFLLQGVQEGNPIVRLAIAHAPNPLIGLIAIKLAAMSLGLFCWTTERERLLGRVNILFAAVVAWNLLALIVSAGR